MNENPVGGWETRHQEREAAERAELEFRRSREAKITIGRGEGLIGISQRQPPSNLEAEQALLGGLLANNKPYARISTYLRPEHFADPIHGEIYRRICERIDAGGIADAVLIRSDLENTTILDEVGGVVYLGQLLSAMVGVINVPEYARLILECYLRRQIIEACDVAASAAFGSEDTRDALRLITDLRMALVAVEAHAESPDKLRSIAHAVDVAIEKGREAARRGNRLSGLSCGFDCLDQFIGGLEPGTNTVIGARPGVGKTALGLQMGMRMARAGSRILYVSLEMDAWKLGRRALSLASRVTLKDIRAGEFERDDSLAEDIVRGRQTFEGLPLLIEEEPRLTMPAIAARAKAAERKLGRLDALFIDHLHIVGRDERMLRMNDVQAIAEISAGISALAKRMQIPAITLAQLSRAVEGRDDKRPTSADLRGSGAIEQDADTIGFIYRPEAGLRPPERKDNETDGDFAARKAAYDRRLAEVKGKAWVHFTKVRDGEEGAAELCFDGAYVRFYEKEERR